MAATFNTPPGWPTPPEGWTPPPGWEPDPSWPPAPPGWQFWSDGGAAPAAGVPSTPDGQPTQSFDAAPTQVSPTAQSGPDLYRYAPTAGLEQPGPSPYGTPDSAGAAPYAPAGYSPTGQGPGGYPPAGYSPGSSPPGRNKGAIIAIAAVAVLVLGAIIWGAASLFGQGDEEATGDPTTSEPTTADPTDPVTTDEPTDPATDEPTDVQTAGPMTDLASGEPALATGYDGVPVTEVRLLGSTPGWEASGSMFCSEPENGQYIALDLEFTTLPALAEQDPATYTFVGWEMGALAGDTVIETSAFIGMLCLDSSESPPSEMQPEQTYTGTVLLDVPTDVTAVTFTNLFDFSGDHGPYRWVLADQ